MRWIQEGPAPLTPNNDGARAGMRSDALNSAPYNLTGAGDPMRLTAVRVTAGFFPVMGVAPLAGRWFTPEEDRPGGGGVVVVVRRGLWADRRWQLLVLAAPVSLVSPLLTFGDTRFKMPIYPTLAVCAAVAVVTLARRGPVVDEVAPDATVAPGVSPGATDKD